MFDFNDQKALVTGAASGIGLGIAQLLGRSGASLIVVDRNAQGLLAADLPEDCIRVYGDITERDVREEILSYGPIPLSIQNAGIADTEGGFLLGKDQEYLEVFQTNLFAPWSLSREIAKELIRSKQSGSMVMISSLHAHHVRRMPAYSTSKAALEMLIREMAWELGPYGIRVNGVVPGGVRTKLTATGSHARESMFPLGRRQTLEDIAKMCAVLLDNTLSGQTTGETIKVDGGLDLFSWHSRGDERE